MSLDNYLTDSTYMQRCLQLAHQGEGSVAPNPIVGAVLVHNGRIIGEGFHASYGQAHAEVNCLASVSEKDKHLISESVLYVSLEPCSHHGRTPPCTDLILKHRIKQVVVGCRDSFALVDGSGIEKLIQSGVHVRVGILEKECLENNRPFFTFHRHIRPYIMLKWAESADGLMAPVRGRRVMLSNIYAQHYVHKLRSNCEAILVGFNTAILDNPILNTRFWTGKHPLRLTIDPKCQLPPNLNIFTDRLPTIVFNNKKEGYKNAVRYLKMTTTFEEGIVFWKEILYHLHQINIQSLMVEGGAAILSDLIRWGLWDEAQVIRTPIILGDGLPAPSLKPAMLKDKFSLTDNNIFVYQKSQEI